MMKSPKNLEFKYEFNGYTFCRPTMEELQSAVAEFFESQHQPTPADLNAQIEHYVCLTNPQMPQHEIN
jgi:hypothetical protein